MVVIGNPNWRLISRLHITSRAELGFLLKNDLLWLKMVPHGCSLIGRFLGACSNKPGSRHGKVTDPRLRLFVIRIREMIVRFPRFHVS